MTSEPRAPPDHFDVGLHWDGTSIDGGIMVRYSARQTHAVALNKDDVILPGRNVRLVVQSTF
jgi:hypothetical protein